MEDRIKGYWQLMEVKRWLGLILKICGEEVAFRTGMQRGFVIPQLTGTGAICLCRHLLHSHRHRRRRDTLCPLPPHGLQGMTTHAFFESPCCMDHACACDTHGHRASSVRAQGSLEVHKTVQFVSTPFSSYETRIQGASPGSPRGP